VQAQSGICIQKSGDESVSLSKLPANPGYSGTEYPYGYTPADLFEAGMGYGPDRTLQDAGSLVRLREGEENNRRFLDYRNDSLRSASV